MWASTPTPVLGLAGGGEGQAGGLQFRHSFTQEWWTVPLSIMGAPMHLQAGGWRGSPLAKEL